MLGSCLVTQSAETTPNILQERELDISHFCQGLVSNLYVKICRWDLNKFLYLSFRQSDFLHAEISHSEYVP